MIDSNLARAISNPAELFSAARAARSEATGGVHAGNDPSGGISFDDVLDALNPLQHMQGIGSIFRELTGDEPSPIARGAGNFLFNGNPEALLALARERFNDRPVDLSNPLPAGDLSAMMAARMAARDIPVNPMIEDGPASPVRFDRI